jgi:hypothetical protein
MEGKKGKKVILDDLSFYAGVELGINDEREARIRNLGVNELTNTRYYCPVYAFNNPFLVVLT